jgi:hypothetical protein
MKSMAMYKRPSTSPRLAPKALHQHTRLGRVHGAGAAGAHAAADHLQRELAPQIGPPRLVDDAHAPAPELADDLVGAEVLVHGRLSVRLPANANVNERCRLFGRTLP